MTADKKHTNLNSEEWGSEAEQNWVGFWNLMVQEFIRQYPEEYKRLKENEKDKEFKKLNNKKI